MNHIYYWGDPAAIACAICGALAWASYGLLIWWKRRNNPVKAD